jgi:hypothetical protein
MKFLKILRSLCTGKVLRIVLCSVLCLACLGCTAWALTSVALGRSNSEQAAQTGTHIGIMDRFEKAINNQFSVSMDGLLSIDKVYWLRDEDVIAPEPNQDLFGETTDPADIAQVLKDAEKLLDGQEVLFSPDRNIIPGSTIRYYLDDTILVITWQEHYLNSIYTLSEIKLAHPSQFRRFFAGNQYGYDKQFHTTQMSADVNAVVASSGDFYKHRYDGLVVYNGVVERVDYSYGVESCLIDDQGNMRFSKIGQLMNKAEAQKYVDENNIRFSISFGPILVENGVKRVPGWYMLGEIADPYPRSALCQAGDLHYYIIISNAQPPYNSFHTLYTFADYVAATGCDMAYTLDGGQTATLAMNDQHINPVQYGSQRFISDIFYFATAIPDGGQ